MPLIFVLQQIFAFGLGLLFGVLNVFLRDVKELVTIILTFWFWLTPLVWVPEVAPEWLQHLQTYINPADWFIAAYRDLFMYHRLPDTYALSRLVVVAHVILLSAWFLLKKLERDIRDFL